MPNFRPRLFKQQSRQLARRRLVTFEMNRESIDQSESLKEIVPAKNENPPSIQVPKL